MLADKKITSFLQDDKRMDKDDAFLKELQINDKVKVTVNFFGQEMPFEGTCTGKTDEKICILTNAKPDPVEFPLSAILEGTVTNKNKINIKESSEDNTYENIEINHPEILYGYYVVDLNKKSNINNFTNNINEFNKTDIPSALLISLREFHTNKTINNLYNNNAFDLNKITKFNEFYKNNKDQNINEVYKKYLGSLNIFININKVKNNKTLLLYLQEYLKSIVYLDSFYYFPFLPEESQLFINNVHLDTIVALLQIMMYSSNIENYESQKNTEQYANTYLNTLFKCQLTLKLLYNISINDLFKNRENDIKLGFGLRFFSLFIAALENITSDDEEKKLLNLLDSWYEEQTRKYDLLDLSSSSKQSDTEFINKHVLIPLVSINKPSSHSTKYELIKFLYRLYVSDSNLLYIKITNSELHTKLRNYITTEHNFNSDLSLSLITIFNQFTKIIDLFFSKIFKIYNAFTNITFYDKNIKDLYNAIYSDTDSIIQLLENEAHKYIIVTIKFNNRIKSFFKRLTSITSPVNKLDFTKAEEQLLLSYQNCSDLIKASNEEILSENIEFYLSLINIFSHNKEITVDFYSKFVTVINISVIKQAISLNKELNRIFIPLEISSSKYGQISYILKISTKSSLTDKTNNESQSNVKLYPDNHLFHLVEISYTDFNSVLKNGFDIDISLEYKVKTSWDFEKCEATWETREVSESFCIRDEFDHLTEFHEIRNLFRDYSSGSVIKDDRMFFGRELDIKHVIENIRNKSGRIITNRCFCIYGQTRTGKSSLLYHIKKGLQSSPSNIIVDIGDIGSAGASEAGIKYRILSCLLEEIELEHDDICNLLIDADISMTADPERNKTDESYFTEQIDKIRSILRRKAKDAQIIILIDEFTYVYDWIKEKKLSEDFMKFWKAFIANHDVCAIIVGQDHMMKFINDQRFTNAFGAIETWEVNYLKEPDARKLVTIPVSDNPNYAGQYGCTILPDAVNLLLEMTSGSAYLLMNICADFIDYLNERHALTATGAHAEDFLRRNLSKIEERWFEPLFNDKSDLDSDASITANKELLKKLALSYSEHYGVLPDELSLTEEEKERLQNLEARRVVEMNDGRWRITVRLYAEWLRNKFGSK